MINKLSQEVFPTIETLDDLAKLVDYSLIDTLNCDPDAKENGVDHEPRQVFTGHYVPVNPTPIKDPEYVTHSKNFFRDLIFQTNWRNQTILFVCFLVTFHMFQIRCAQLDGRLDMRFLSLAPNTISNAHSKLATDMAMVAQFL